MFRGRAQRPAMPALQPSPRGAFLASLFLPLLHGPLLAETITAARFADPTTRYTHGVLGDAVEWGTLEIELQESGWQRAVLPQRLVFEDIAPRLWDLDADGAPEVIVIESDRDLGARLAIWGAEGRIAATPHIGQRNRWLAPVGAADLDGDGVTEIAFVDRPHLARVLRVWRYNKGRLTEVASLEGFSNHRIGWDYIEGGVRDCGEGPELVLASGDWRSVMAVRLDDKGMNARSLGDYSAASLEAAIECR